MRHLVIDGETLAGLTSPEIALAAVVFKLYAQDAAGREGGVHRGVLALRDRLVAFARENSMRTLPLASGGQRFEPESGMGTLPLAVPEFLTTAQAAAVIGISEQAVTARCRSRGLIAVKTRGGWEIDADSAAALAARRRGT